MQSGTALLRLDDVKLDEDNDNDTGEKSTEIFAAYECLSNARELGLKHPGHICEGTNALVLNR